MRPLTILEAPSSLGLRQQGVEGLPRALRACGLLEGLPDVLHDHTAVPVPPRAFERKPNAVLNQAAIQVFSIRLADRISAILEQGRFPFVLGGDCSILLGSALALRRLGRYGLFFIDGHADFYSRESEPNGEVASMELAIATGRDPEVLSDLEGRRPLVREEDVVVFACRDAESAREHGSPDVRDTAMRLFDLAATRSLGTATAANRGLAMLEAGGVEGFFIHLDADVLHDDVMPAVDYRAPDGLHPGELTAVLRVLLESRLVVGLEVTIYNPALDDAGHTAGRALVQAINAAFRAPHPPAR